MRISDWSSDVCSSDLLVTEGRIVDIVAEGFDLGLRTANLVPTDMIAIPVGPPRSFAVVASPSYFKVNDKPRTPPDLLRQSCIRVRLPKGGRIGRRSGRGRVSKKR